MLLTSSTRGTTSSSGADMILVMEGLPCHYTWQDVKDLARNKAEHGIRANDYATPWSASGGSKIWLVTLTRAVEAYELYNWLAGRRIEGQVLTLHLKVDGALVRSNCMPASCSVCHPPISTAPQYQIRDPTYAIAPQYAPTVTTGQRMPLTYTTSGPPAHAMYGSAASAPRTAYNRSPSITDDVTQAAQTAADRLRAREASGMALSAREVEFLGRFDRLTLRDRPSASQPPLSGAPVFAAMSASGTPINTSNGWARTETRGIFVSGLGYKTRQPDVEAHFARVGRIVRCDVQVGAQGRSKGTATVQFETATEAKEALAMNNSELRGRIIHVRSDREAVILEAPSSRTSTSASTDPATQGPIIANGSNSRQARRDSKVSTLTKY